MKYSYHSINKLTKSDGTIRKIGVELEFSGIDVDVATNIILETFGGEVVDDTPAYCSVKVPGFGDFRIELDWDFYKRRAAESATNGEDLTWLKQLGKAAALVVPIEIACPPLPISEIDRLNPMLVALRQAGAVGTSESVLAGYGVHLNVETPALDAPTLWSYLRVYSLLQWWLVKAHDVDLTRRISPFVNLYPESYVQKLAGYSEAPPMGQLIDDYLEANPTRNRALDMLPMFMVIDEPRVNQAVKDQKIKARPTFHYRLPNCQIEDPEWSLANSWNIWAVIEECASRTAIVDELAVRFLEADVPLLGVNRSDWIETILQWLNSHKLA